MSQTHPEPTLNPAADERAARAPLGEEQLRELALRRLKKKRDFRGHLVVYGLVNLALWAAWAIGGLVDGWVFPWPVFPTVIWGLFVLGHANDVYWRRPLTEDAIQAEIDELRASPGLQRLETEPDDDWC